MTKELYDENANRILLEYPDGAKESWKYNEKGLLIQHCKANGQKILWEYDKCHNLTKQKEQLENEKYAVTSYKRDQKGRITESKDPNGFVTKYEYKGAGDALPTTILYPDGCKIVAEYDAVCRKISETIDGCTTTYSYTNHDKILKEEDPEGNVTTTIYNKMDEPIQKYMPNAHQSKQPPDNLVVFPMRA